jgi:hypothetical protein
VDSLYNYGHRIIASNRMGKPRQPNTTASFVARVMRLHGGGSSTSILFQSR